MYWLLISTLVWPRVQNVQQYYLDVFFNNECLLVFRRTTPLQESYVAIRYGLQKNEKRAILAHPFYKTACLTQAYKPKQTALSTG